MQPMGYHPSGIAHATSTMEQVSSSLENRERLVQRLRWPQNLGIELRDLRIGPGGQWEAILLWIEGMVSADSLPPEAVDRLCHHWAGGPGALRQALPLQRIEFTESLTEAIDRLLSGWLLLLVNGSPWAVLVQAENQDVHPNRRQSSAGWEEVFDRNLRRNLGLLRRRLRSTELLALPIPFPPQRACCPALAGPRGRTRRP